MSKIEFEVRGHKYSAARLDLFDANIVVRRLSAPLMWMAQARRALEKANAEAAKKNEKQIPPPSEEAFAQALVGTSSDISRADLDASYSLCLGTVQRSTETGWQRLMAGGRPMFDDVDLMTMQKIVYKVLVGNDLIDFFSEGSSAPSSSSALES